MYEQLRVSAIVAVADNGVIGRDGALPWHLPADLARFKRLTSGHAVVMGRRTWQELGRPLPRRMNVVISPSLRASGDFAAGPRLAVVTSAQQALEVAAGWERQRVQAGDLARGEIFLLGGTGVWTALWPRVDRLYRTRVHHHAEGDVCFPPVDLSAFTRTHVEAVADALATTFEIWDRRSGP